MKTPSVRSGFGQARLPKGWCVDVPIDLPTELLYKLKII